MSSSRLNGAVTKSISPLGIRPRITLLTENVREFGRVPDLKVIEFTA